MISDSIPGQDLLFFVEPDHVDKKAILVLGTETEIEAALTQRQKPGADGVVFKDLGGESWCIKPALITLRSDGSFSPPHPWIPGGPAMPLLPDSSDTGREIVDILNSANPPWTVRGDRWTHRQCESVRLRFHPLLSAVDDDPLYEPMVSLSAGDESLDGSLFAVGDSLLVLDGHSHNSGLKERTGDFIWFLRLILSRKVLGASDIRARFAGTRYIPEEIEVEIPELPEALKILKPVLVLEISGNGGTTDFKPLWQYEYVFDTSGP